MALLGEEAGFPSPKQDAEASTGTSAPVTQLPSRFSTSVTTGQGGLYNSWAVTGGKSQYGSGRLGNNRAPIPTCSIPPPRRHPNITMMPLAEGDKKSASAAVADKILGVQPVVQPAVPHSAATGSGSVESTQEQLPAASEDGSYPHTDDSDISDEEDDRRSEDGLRRSTRNQSKSNFKVVRKGKEKKKVGRPIAYKGDPNAPELTEQERRRIKRRIANRESARRVRHKRQEILEEMQGKMEHMQSHNIQLMRHAQEVEAQKSQLFQQLVELESKFKKTAAENIQMQQEIQGLRSSLQLKMTALEQELDKREHEAEPVTTSAFSAPASQPVVASYPMSQQFSSSQHGPMDSKASLDAGMALEFFPSLNLDDLPVRAESLDMLASMLHDDPTTAASMLINGAC